MAHGVRAARSPAALAALEAACFAPDARAVHAAATRAAELAETARIKQHIFGGR